MDVNEMFNEMWHDFYPPMDIEDAYDEFNKKVLGTSQDVIDEAVAQLKDKTIKNDIRSEMMLMMYLGKPDMDMGIRKLIAKNPAIGYMDVSEKGDYNSMFILYALKLSGMMTNKDDCEVLEEVFQKSIKKYAELGHGKFNCWLFAMINEYVRCKAYCQMNMETLVTNQALNIINDDVAV